MSLEIITKNAANLVCVSLDVHTWSGRRTMKKADLIRANPDFSKLPEKELASIGSIKICDPAEIKKFASIKRQAETLLERNGLPILKAVGIPADKFAAVHQELKRLQIEYQDLTTKFVSKYYLNIQIWQDKHLATNPEWEYLFDQMPTPEHVGGRLSFHFHSTRISAPGADSDPILNAELNESFNEEIGGLKGQLIREVAKEAERFVTSMRPKDANQDREYVTPKTVGPLRRATEKLKAFGFVDPAVGGLADSLTDLLDEMPSQGQITGSKLFLLVSVSRMLQSAQSINDLFSTMTHIEHNQNLIDVEVAVAPQKARTVTVQKQVLDVGNNGPRTKPAAPAVELNSSLVNWI